MFLEQTLYQHLLYKLESGAPSFLWSSLSGCGTTRPFVLYSLLPSRLSLLIASFVLSHSFYLTFPTPLSDSHSFFL